MKILIKMNKILLLLAFLSFIACKDNVNSPAGDSQISNTTGANNIGTTSNTSMNNGTSANSSETTTEIVVDENSSEIKTTRMNKVSKGNVITGAKYADRTGIESSFDGLRGKTVIIDLWATWCTPCIDAMPAFDKIANDLSANKDLAFLKLSVDEDKSGWVNYVNEKQHGKNSYWIGRDESNPLFWLTYKNIDYEGKQLVLESLPRYVIVGPDGAVINSEAPSPLTGKLLGAINSLNI